MICRIHSTEFFQKMVKYICKFFADIFRFSLLIKQLQGYNFYSETSNNVYTSRTNPEILLLEVLL